LEDEKVSLNLIMGARNGAKNERQEHDYYATHPQAVRDFLCALNRDGVVLNNNIWECACGEGHMANVFVENGYKVYATDLVNRGYGGIHDFLKTEFPYYGDIFTNPPFKFAEEFAYKGNEILDKGHKFGLFVKIQFLESKSRKILFEQYPPKYIYVYSERQQCSMNGDFENLKAKTQAYIWVIWEKGYKGETITRWI
jgi:hypothetical protein